MKAPNGKPEPEIIPPGGDEGPKSSSNYRAADDIIEDITGLARHPMTVPRITYGLYALAAVSGFPMLIGLIVAYVARSEAPAWQHTHYTFLIYTFWVGLALILIGLMTWIIGVGMFLLWLLPLWYLIRVVRGWIWLENRKAVPYPQSFLFG